MDTEEIKLCKRGHQRTPDNISKSGACKECEKLLRPTYIRKKYIRTPEQRAQQKEWRATSPVYKKSQEQRLSKQIVYDGPIRLCKNGHPRTPDNVYSTTGACKTCVKMNKKTSQYKKANNERIKKRYKEDSNFRERRINTVKRTNKIKGPNSLNNGYIASLLGATVPEIPLEYLELKRLHILAKRELKNVSNNKCK